MDEETVDKAGDKPIVPGIERIRGLSSKQELAAEVARLHDLGVDIFFRFGSRPDPDNSKMNIADADQAWACRIRAIIYSQKMKRQGKGTLRTSRGCSN